jgi:hypothetical protein
MGRTLTVPPAACESRRAFRGRRQPSRCRRGGALLLTDLSSSVDTDQTRPQSRADLGGPSAPRPLARAGLALPLAVALAALASCSPKAEQLFDRVFACDTSGEPGQCGSTRDGKAMVCYAGHLLGGQDFCAPPCDPGQAPADDRFTCLSSGALVQRCKPHDDPRYACPDKLSCYRTDLMNDDGICLMMNVCTKDSDCGGSPGRVCAGTLVRGAIASADSLATDSLQCIVDECESFGECPSDQACLSKVYATGNVLPEICVPRCDNARCPPNFSCARKDDWAPGAEAVCVPGMPGVRCDHHDDCLIGECLDTGAGFRVCTLPTPCRPVDYCAKLDGPVDPFVCLEGVPGQPHCLNTRALGGANCTTTADCAVGSGRQCFWNSMFEDSPMHGECRLPCGLDGRCASLGGLPFFCLGENAEGGCYPTQFGAPCLEDKECFELACVEVGRDAHNSATSYSTKICTLPCATDADCDANHLARNRSFCQTEVGYCRLAGPPDAPCTQPTHCRSRRCGPLGVCLP